MVSLIENLLGDRGRCFASAWQFNYELAIPVVIFSRVIQSLLLEKAVFAQ